MKGEQQLELKLGDTAVVPLSKPGPGLDAQLQTLWQKGREAWKNVPSATAWVEELRGHAAYTLPD